MNSTRSHSPFHVGDQVQIDFGRRKLTGTIVEDRGAIGVRGRHLFSVSVPIDPFDPMLVEVPDDEIEALQPGAAATSPPLKNQIIEYLASGGLISILRSNISGGPNPSRVWLRPDSLGNVTHTFIPERGIVGGDSAPASTIHNGRIRPEKRDAVLSFLQSFGLDREEAKKVLSAIAREAT